VNSVTRSARALNIATRLRVLTDTNVLIGGFIITGTEPKRVIIRAIGPSLGTPRRSGRARRPGARALRRGWQQHRLQQQLEGNAAGGDRGDNDPAER
jgi:hypothetical protein